MKKTFIIAAAVAATIFAGSSAIAGDYHHKRQSHAYHAPYWYAPVYHFFHRGHYRARHYHPRAHRRYHRAYRRWLREHRRWHRHGYRHDRKYHRNGPRDDRGGRDRRRRNRG